MISLYKKKLYSNSMFFENWSFDFFKEKINNTEFLKSVSETLVNKT